MMESCLSDKADRREQVEVDDLKRDLSSEFSTLPDPQVNPEVTGKSVTMNTFAHNHCIGAVVLTNSHTLAEFVKTII